MVTAIAITLSFEIINGSNSSREHVIVYVQRIIKRKSFTTFMIIVFIFTIFDIFYLLVTTVTTTVVYFSRVKVPFKWKQNVLMCFSNKFYKLFDQIKSLIHFRYFQN